MISQTIKSLNEAILKIEPTLTILSFMQSKINLGDKCPTVTQGEINAVQLSFNSRLTIRHSRIRRFFYNSC